MDLTFLGRGSAFNPKEGNTSAYFIDNNELFLIDCGESVFSKLITNNILNNISKINLMITHTHSDHIGSIGSLIMYSYYKLNSKVNIILPRTNNYAFSIASIINNFGCNNDMYNFVLDFEYDDNYSSFKKIRFKKKEHDDKLECFSILIYTKCGIVFYSGDTKEIDTLMSIINSTLKIDKIYIDTTSENYPGNVHLNIDIINENIKDKLKDKVYCMHVNNDDCIKLIKKYGFKYLIYSIF